MILLFTKVYRGTHSKENEIDDAYGDDWSSLATKEIRNFLEWSNVKRSVYLQFNITYPNLVCILTSISIYTEISPLTKLKKSMKNAKIELFTYKTKLTIHSVFNEEWDWEEQVSNTKGKAKQC
jgi:hypothetical protein